MLLRIQHETKLTYTAPVSDTVFEVRMAPPSNEDQTAMGYNLRISPQAPVTSYRDGFGNRVDLFNLSTFYRELILQATSYVRTHRSPAVDRLKAIPAPATRSKPVSIEAAEFLQHSPLIDHSPNLDGFLSTLPPFSGSFVDALQMLLEAVRSRLKYEKRVTTARTPVGEALELGRGVCQDFAHLYIAACRGSGIPARYVSGYLNQTGELATHAWCQVWIDEATGWIDIDPTHNEFVGDDHVVTAVGRDYFDVPPNRGLWKGRAEEVIGASVRVEPVERMPLEWNEWELLGSRSNSGAMQSQRQGQDAARVVRHTRAAYPNQRNSHSGLLHQQQGQQQQ